jgi:hypothetical protein
MATTGHPTDDVESSRGYLRGFDAHADVVDRQPERFYCGYQAGWNACRWRYTLRGGRGRREDA